MPPRKPHAPGLPLADPTEVKRRLAAIFAADVEGYSRLMGADEVATLDALTARREILDGLIARLWRPYCQHGWRQCAGGVWERGGCRPLRHGGSGRPGRGQLNAS